MPMGGGHVSVKDGQAVHGGWTYVHVAAAAASVPGGHLYASCKQQLSVWGGHVSLSAAPLGLHNKFT